MLTHRAADLRALFSETICGLDRRWVADDAWSDAPTCLWCAAERPWRLIPWNTHVGIGVSVINTRGLQRLSVKL